MLHFMQIKKLQKKYGIAQMQSLINNGECWKLEGSFGRMAMQFLEAGICMLPKKRHFDYYGNTVPSRNDIKKGTKGSFQKCNDFWLQILDNSVSPEEFQHYI